MNLELEQMEQDYTHMIEIAENYITADQIIGQNYSRKLYLHLKNSNANTEIAQTLISELKVLCEQEKYDFSLVEGIYTSIVVSPKVSVVRNDELLLPEKRQIRRSPTHFTPAEQIYICRGFADVLDYLYKICTIKDSSSLVKPHAASLSVNIMPNSYKNIDETDIRLYIQGLFKDYTLNFTSNAQALAHNLKISLKTKK